ncbi:DM7 family protein GG17591 [Drosophila miranda]|uniref:DM7 family protein GG17591 n=1 Tax=Drosophila miranda TaxID=7229 RepID=UPI0007E664CC|nr:DM7 family protein GG17591 [Drosophila miranda]
MSKKNVGLRKKMAGYQAFAQQTGLDLDPELDILIPGSTNERNSLICCQHVHSLMHSMNSLSRAKLRYVPNLRNLVVPKSTDLAVLMLLSVEHYPHDPDAAKLLKEEKNCLCFELPVERFPVHTPISRMIFLSPKLLPPSFDAGGVFGPGVLPRKFYPIGMLPSQHKGPTPALFVGRRVLKEILKGLETDLICPLSTTVGMSSADTQQRLSRCKVAMGFVGADPNTMAMMKKYIDNPVPTQYNIYVPDLTDMRVVMANATDAMMPYAMTVISTVVQPHVPNVSLDTMNAPGPKFQLPKELFPPEIIGRKPVFIPTRYLPKNFDAGCVFAPGALPYAWFQGLLLPHTAPVQHSSVMSPPLFFGRWKAKQQKLKDSAYVPPGQPVPSVSNPPVSSPPSSVKPEKELVDLIFGLYGNEKEIEVGSMTIRRLALDLVAKNKVPAGTDVEVVVGQYRSIMRSRAAKRDNPAPPPPPPTQPQPQPQGAQVGSADIQPLQKMSKCKQRFRGTCCHCGKSQ